MSFPTPPDPRDMFHPPMELGPEMSDEEIRRQIEWREELELFARQLRAWWWANQQDPISQADPVIVVKDTKLTLSKPTLAWFEAAQKEGVEDPAKMLGRYVLSAKVMRGLVKK